LTDIRQQFAFLFERGYEIKSTSHDPSMPIWEIILEKQDLFIKMCEDRGGPELYCGSSAKGFVEFKSLIYFLSNGKDIIFDTLNWKKPYADLLQKYLDQIEACFGSE